MKDIQWFPGHMAKTRRLIEEKINLIDIVIEIVDARIPWSSKNPIMDKLVKNKKKVMIMSKVDLADPKKTIEWTEFYKNEGFQVIASNLMNFKELNKIIEQVDIEMKDKRERDFKRGLRQKPVRALIVGIPNVGKSTLINKMAKRKSAKVGDKAGVTKALQWIKIGNNFELLDSPGILWPKFDDEQVAINLALTGAIKEEILPKEDLCIYAIKFMNEHYQKELYARYNISDINNDDINSIVNALDTIGRDRGCLLKNNEINYEKVYDIILREIKDASITRMTFDYDVIKK